MRGSVILIALLGVLLIGGCGGCNSYNGFVSKGTDVDNAWSKVQSAYQRRADLIPNIVETVKGEANFEKSTLTGIVEARAKATSMNIDPSKITPEQMKSFQENQQGLSNAIGRLLVVTENYPQLRANDAFRQLQAQLEGTENRIKVERDKYNDVATDYNKSVRLFPGNIFARLFGFAERLFLLPNP